MAARSLASLTIAFGLVSIPVKLYSATQPSGGVSFHLLHKTCGSRLRQQYLCLKEEVIVPRSEMVKGYEFAKDQYVVFTPEEMEELEEAASHSVEVTEFLPVSAIDPVYYDKAYYLAPDKGGAKPYALFVEAMRRTGRSALGRYAYLNLGGLLHSRKHRIEAEQVYRAGLEHCADRATLHFNLAILAEDCGQIAQALGHYREGLVQDPRFGEAHHNLARLYAALGNSQEALRAYHAYRRLAQESD